MAAIVQGTAVLRLELDATKAIAERDKFLRGWGVGPMHVPGAPGTIAPPPPGPGGGGGGGGGIPLGGPSAAPGGGFLSGILSSIAGLGIVAASPLGQVGIGVGKRAMGALSDVSEAIGASSFMRDADRPAKAADRTVAQLGIAANFMSSEQIVAFNNMNRMMVDLEVGGENKVRQTIGQDRVEGALERMLEKLDQIAGNTKHTAENTKVSHKIQPGNH